ncbi:MAG TPA: GGDEF domain-containing protein [Spirochaetota bacterium]|nr:GGDEF domain-containing protein [Spirochaetota bacterium]
MTDKKSLGKTAKNSLGKFDINAARVMALLLKQDPPAEDMDEAIDILREMKISHFTLQEKNKLLETEINLDSKTGLLKYKDSYLDNILKSVSRALDKKDNAFFDLSYIRFDVDDFSVFNNKYGHDIGDQVLHSLAFILKENSRPTDFCIRFGGEEFDLMLPSTEKKGAEVVIKKVFNAVTDLSVPYEDKFLGVTVSAGLTTLSLSADKLSEVCKSDMRNLYKDLQQEADNALYEAKYEGKNRYCIYDKKKQREYSRIRKKYVEVD